MARSGFHLMEIGEKFCQCPICLQQYKKPKLLPCLHRYCSDCLKQLIERNRGVNILSCPECRDNFPVPENGIDGFKTDFSMKNITEYIRLQKSLKDEQMRNCCDTTKKVKVIAYCFKCNDFLCKECYNIHLTKKMVKDHKYQTFSLEDIQSKHLTLEKLSLLKEAPRCQSHPEDLCRLCCRTCNNLPICVNCTYGSHENHSIKEVTMLAAQARDELRSEITTLSASQDRIYNMAKTVERVKKELASDVEKKKETFQRIYDWNVKNIKAEMKNIENDNKAKKIEIENKKERDLMEKQKQMEREIKEITIKYENICDEIAKDYKTKLDHLKQTHDKDLYYSTTKLSELERDFNQLMTAIEKTLEEKVEKLNNMSQKISGIQKRFENLKTTAHFVLEAENDWTTVQCIPDIQTAFKPSFNVEMKMKFPELETLSRVYINTEVKESEESPIDIEESEATGFLANDITSVSDGSIVITGNMSKSESHITHVSMKGSVLLQKKMLSLNTRPSRYCAFLSQYKVATVCSQTEIGVYDLRDGTYINKNIPDVISTWPANCSVTCVAVDPVNNHILVVGNGTRVYVFDYQLNYLQTIILPKPIRNVCDMTVSGGNLVVCDRSYPNMTVYVVRMERLQCQLPHKLTKPKQLDGTEWRPQSACTDKHGFMYLLWKRVLVQEVAKCIVQYNPYDYQPLTTIMTYENAKCITIVKEINQTEKLLIATRTTNKIYKYDIGGVCVL